MSKSRSNIVKGDFVPKTREINREQLSEELSRLLTSPIAYHRIYAEVCNDVLAAVMLSQAVHWSNHTTEPDGSFYKTQEEWYDETALTRRNQESARKTLTALKDETGKPFWIEVRRGIPARLFYRIDHKVLTRMMLEAAANPKTFPKYPNKLGVIGQTVESKGLAQIGVVRPTGEADSAQLAGLPASNYSENTHEITHESFLGDVHTPQTPSEQCASETTPTLLADHLHRGAVEVTESEIKVGDMTFKVVIDPTMDKGTIALTDYTQKGTRIIKNLGNSPTVEVCATGATPTREAPLVTPDADAKLTATTKKADFAILSPLAESTANPSPEPEKTQPAPVSAKKKRIPRKGVGEKTPEQKQRDADHVEMFDYLRTRTGQPILDGGAQAAAIHRILNAKFTVEQAKEVLDHQLAGHWRGPVSWKSVQMEISDYFRRKSSTPTNGGNYGKENYTRRDIERSSGSDKRNVPDLWAYCATRRGVTD